MTSQMISVDLIDPPKTPAEGDEKISKGEVRKIADSFKEVGLLQAIGLRPRTDGRYEIIYGRHRFLAVKQHLKWPEIEAKVYDGFDDDDATMARITENLHRRGRAKKKDYYEHVRIWADLLAKKHPEMLGRAAGAAVREANKAAAAQAQKTDGDGTDPPPAAAKVATIPQIISDVTGRSERTSKQDLRIAKAFDEEQLTTMEAVGIYPEDMERISFVKDPTERAAAVNLAVSGMDVKDAIANATGKAPANTEGTPGSAEPDPAAKEESAYTQQEWIDLYCGEFRARLGGNTRAYDRSAGFYRLMRDARAAFQAKLKKALDLYMSQEGSNGPCVVAVNRVCRMAHPRDWLLCGTCQGTGKDGDCKECRGDGFKLKVENR